MMSDINSLMNEIRAKNWLPDNRFTKVSRVSHNTIGIQTSIINNEGLKNLHEMDRVEIKRVTSATDKKIAIVLEVQRQ